MSILELQNEYLSDTLLECQQEAEASGSPVLKKWINRHFKRGDMYELDEQEIFKAVEAMLNDTDGFIEEPPTVKKLRDAYLAASANGNYVRRALINQKSDMEAKARYLRDEESKLKKIDRRIAELSVKISEGEPSILNQNTRNAVIKEMVRKLVQSNAFEALSDNKKAIAKKRDGLTTKFRPLRVPVPAINNAIRISVDEKGEYLVEIDQEKLMAADICTSYEFECAVENFGGNQANSQFHDATSVESDFLGNDNTYAVEDYYESGMIEEMIRNESQFLAVNYVEPILQTMQKKYISAKKELEELQIERNILATTLQIAEKVNALLAKITQKLAALCSGKTRTAETTPRVTETPEFPKRYFTQNGEQGKNAYGGAKVDVQDTISKDIITLREAIKFALENSCAIRILSTTETKVRDGHAVSWKKVFEKLGFDANKVSFASYNDAAKGKLLVIPRSMNTHQELGGNWVNRCKKAKVNMLYIENKPSNIFNRL